MDRDISVVLAYKKKNGVVIEVDEDDYPIWVELGKWKDKGELKYKPYLEAKVEGKIRKVDIAIRISIDNDDEIVKIDTDAGDVYECVEANGVIYYFPPEKRVGNQAAAISHVVTVGHEVINIHLNSNVESMTLIAGATDEAVNHYTEYINDLLFMHQQLCINKDSSMAMALKYSEYVLEDTQRIVEEFCNAYEAIANNPTAELHEHIERVPICKVKKNNIQNYT